MGLFTRAGATPLAGVDAILADLDGVVYKGPNAIPHAVESLEAARHASVRIGYVTNNASRTDVQVAQHLTDLGLRTHASEVITSPMAAVSLLRQEVPAGSTILVVGGEGLTNELEKAGFRWTRSADDEPAAVVQGFAPEVGWKELAEAAFALQRSIPWIATNTDWTIPVARGIAPGNGTLVSAVHTAVGRMATVAGKPERAIFDEAVKRLAARSALVIGDRLDTDIVGANRAELSTAFVLTGVDRAKQVLAADKESRPRFILGDLRELHEPYPRIELSKDGRSCRVREAVVTLVDGSHVSVERRGEGLDLLRAACALIWSTGRAIWAFDVPAELITRSADEGARIAREVTGA